MEQLRKRGYIYYLWWIILAVIVIGGVVAIRQFSINDKLEYVAVIGTVKGIV